MKTFSALIIRFRWILLVIMTLVTVGLAAEIPKMTANYEYESWLPENDDVAELVREVDEEFSTNMVVFAIMDFEENGVFHPDSLALIQRVTEELEGTEELFSVISLLNIIDIRKTEEGMMVGDLIKEIPRTDAEMKMLKEYVLSKERYVNTIVSANSRFTSLIIHIDSVYDELTVAGDTIKRIRELVGDQGCYFGGDPAVACAMNEYSTQDFNRLIPAMMGVMVLILSFGLRRVLGVVLPLSFVVVCVIWTFGMTVLLGYPFNMLTPPVAIMLIAIGSDYAVHIYNHFLRRRDIVLSMSEIILPVAMSALTTVIGLLTFAVTGIPNLKYFGIELAIGLVSACVISVVLLPIFIYILKARPGPVIADETQIEEHVFSRVLIWFGNRAYDHAGKTLMITGIFLVIMGMGIVRISTDVDFVELLPKDSSPRVGNDILEEHFGGMYANTVFFRGDLGDPAVLARQQYMENFMRSVGLLSSFNSLAGYIAEENWLFSGVYAIPETRGGVSNLWLLLENEEMMEMIVTSERDKGLITSFIRDSATGSIKEVSANIKAFLDGQVSDTVVTVAPERLPPDSARVLKDLRLKDTARQLAWLTERYNEQDQFDHAPAYHRLQEALPGVDERVDLSPVLEELRYYLKEETVEVLPDSLIDQLMAFTKDHWQERNRPEFSREMEHLILAGKAMDARDAGLTLEGLLTRSEFSLRRQRMVALRESLQDLFPAELWQNEHYVKRMEGVVWNLLAAHPVFFLKQVHDIPEIEKGLISSHEISIGQAGFPEILGRLESVLLRSQYMSLVLASLAVFFLVSITQFSARRGLICLLSVLVPLEYVLGVMGWVGIPLDFGTALLGALIIGLGIDGSIHFLHYYHHQREKGIERRQALRATMGHVGKAVITANATTSAGFLMLIFAQTKALRNFAFTSGLAILLVTVSVLTVLPALVVLMGPDKKEGTSNAS